MTLTLPSSDALFDFWGDEADDVDETRATTLIELASNLLWLATGLEFDSTDTRVNMLIQFAILDMAIYLYVTRDNINETYGPYQSERIGSYSYNKTYSALAKTLGSNTGEATGVLFFDKIVDYFLNQALYAGGGLTTSEDVFHRGYQPLLYASTGLYTLYREMDPNIDRRTLYGYFGNADDDEGSYRQSI